MTSLPAHVFGFTGRGEIREGAFADILIFDPAKITDRATYQSPHQMAEGVDWVIVNGQIARREGEFTGVRGGAGASKGQCPDSQKYAGDSEAPEVRSEEPGTTYWSERRRSLCQYDRLRIPSSPDARSSKGLSPIISACPSAEEPFTQCL